MGQTATFLHHTLCSNLVVFLYIQTNTQIINNRFKNERLVSLKKKQTKFSIPFSTPIMIETKQSFVINNNFFTFSCGLNQFHQIINIQIKMTNNKNNHEEFNKVNQFIKMSICILQFVDVETYCCVNGNCFHFFDFENWFVMV